ncbi:PAS domain-containing protein [Pedobacter sp. UYP24]
MQHFKQLKALLGESSTYYLIAVDMESNYSFINRRYSEMFEPVHGNLVGKHYALTLHPDDQQTCKIVSQLAFSYPNNVFPATLRKHDGYGAFIVTRWEYRAMFNDQGAPAGIFCLGHNITELLQAKGDLQQIKYDHSHQVRRHVANLIGLGKLMKEANGAEDIQDVVRMITESADELGNVIRDLYR